MTANDDLGRVLAAWLDDDAANHVADHLDEVLQVTAVARQRPAWSSPERWFPVQTSIRLAPVPRVAWLLVVLALVLALGAAVAVIASQTERLPAPFGPARNGLWVSSVDGHIVAVDPADGSTTPLVAGAGRDIEPNFSPDGTRLAFLRKVTNRESHSLMVADGDGSAVRQVTGAIGWPSWWDWSPDGTQIAFTAGEQGTFVVDVGTGELWRGIGPRVRVRYPTWLPPDGRQIAFQRNDDAGRPTIWAVNPDATELKEPFRLSPDNEADSSWEQFDRDSENTLLAVSPDGTTITFERSSMAATGPHSPRVYALDVASGSERVFPTASGTVQLGPAPFSPDGSLVAYQRVHPDGASQVVVAASDGSGEARPVGPRMSPLDGSIGGCCPVEISFEFTPDGTALIVAYWTDDNTPKPTTHHLPIDGTAGSIVGVFEITDVQRLAP